MIQDRSGTIDPIRAKSLGGVPHGFFGRRGGVSEGAMWGLNTGFGSGDDARLIEENRRRVVEAVLPGTQLATVHQVHSGYAVRVDSPLSEEERPRADAMATDRPGVLLGILTADCAPVLFADEIAGVVGAAHAGWRGALAGVTDATVELMETLGANRTRIAAAVGPCIGQDSYEVDGQFRSRFVEEDPDNERFFAPGRGDRAQFDLQCYVVARLQAAGVSQVEALRFDTYSDADRFFSYRRSIHREEPSYGRQISVIGLRD